MFGANRYPFPEEANRQHVMHREVTMRLRDLSTTIEAGVKLRSSVLQTLSINCDDWITRVIQEKASFHVMNKLSVDNSRKVTSASHLAAPEMRVHVFRCWSEKDGFRVNVWMRYNTFSERQQQRPMHRVRRSWKPYVPTGNLRRTSTRTNSPTDSNSS